MRRRVLETDVCIIGSGISAAMVAERLAETTRARIVIVEAGDESPRPEEFPGLRRRFQDYGESPWPKDHLDDMSVEGIQSRSMCVGGLAMHWGGVTPRFSPEDFATQSLFGVGTDWPITYEELDPFYQEAEERLGVAGEQGPAELDPRGKPFPMPPLPLSWNLERLQGWATKAGIPMWSQPSAKNSRPYKGRVACCRSDTCSPICPVGAKYSPDMTWRALRRDGRVTLLPRTLVRRLVPAARGNAIERAEAVQRDRPDDVLELRARQFVVAGGYVWSAHLLLLSRSTRFPNGVANSSGLVGAYIGGHRNVQGFVELPMKLYPGMNEQHSLVTKAFMRKPRTERYVRHDLRIWESAVGREPRLRDEAGALLLGDGLLADWRARTRTGTARVRGYYDVVPARESGITLDPSRKNAWGDPLPKLALRDDPASAALRGHSEERIREVIAELARAGDGRVVRTSVDEFQDHPAGGCRMGKEAATSVTDAWGRTHDHGNLWVAGAPTMPSMGCANGTLTFCALALRTAHALERELPAQGSRGRS